MERSSNEIIWKYKEVLREDHRIRQKNRTNELCDRISKQEENISNGQNVPIRSANEEIAFWLKSPVIRIWTKCTIVE